MSSIERLIRALESIAASTERIAGYLVPDVPAPTYDRSRPHTSVPNHALIAEVDELNADRLRKGLPQLKFEEAAKALRPQL